MMKLELRYDYPGSKSEKPERCYDIVGDAQACITFVHDGSKDAIARIEEIVQIVNDCAAQDAALVAAREALAKSDPWKQSNGIRWDCIHCGHVYSMIAFEPKETHTPDCVWLAALDAKP